MATPSPACDAHSSNDSVRRAYEHHVHLFDVDASNARICWKRATSILARGRLQEDMNARRHESQRGGPAAPAPDFSHPQRDGADVGPLPALHHAAYVLSAGGAEPRAAAVVACDVAPEPTDWDRCVPHPAASSGGQLAKQMLSSAFAWLALLYLLG